MRLKIFSISNITVLYNKQFSTNMRSLKNSDTLFDAGMRQYKGSYAWLECRWGFTNSTFYHRITIQSGMPGAICDALSNGVLKIEIGWTLEEKSHFVQHFQYALKITLFDLFPKRSYNKK